MKLRAIDHTTLRVPSLALVWPYYEALFGLRCTMAVVDGVATLRLENEHVHFFVDEVPGLDPEHVRAQHISFEVADLSAVIAELESRGEGYTVGDFGGFRRRNYRWCEWRDPAGIRVECIEVASGGPSK